MVDRYSKNAAAARALTETRRQNAPHPGHGPKETRLDLRGLLRAGRKVCTRSGA